MSGEGRDSTYNPKRKTQKGFARETRRRNTRQGDYTEMEVVSSGSDNEGTIISSESGVGSVKTESGLGEQELQGEDVFDSWTTNTFKNTATQVTTKFFMLTEVNRDLEMA